MRKLLLAATLSLAAALAAPADDMVVMCSTVGEDKYADGTTVLPKEFYALVWSPGETFGGYNADGTLKNAGDRQLGIGAVADIDEKDGNMGLPSTSFVVDGALAQSLPEGYLHIVMLDTRNADGTLSTPDDVAAGTGTKKRPSAVNGYEAKGTAAVSAGLAGVKSASETSPIKITRVSSIPGGTPLHPVVSGVRFEGEGAGRTMVMSVTNTVRFLRYTAGEAVPGSAGLPKAEGAVPANGGADATDEIEIRVPAADTNRLFRVIRN